MKTSKKMTEGGVFVLRAPTFILSDDLEELEKKRDDLCDKINVAAPDLFLFWEFQAVARKHAQLCLEKNKLQPIATEEELEKEREEEERWLKEEEAVWKPKDQ